MRLLRLAALLLLMAAGIAFLARLLQPQPIPDDDDADTLYVGPTAAEGPTVTVPDAIPLILPEPRASAEQVSATG